MNEKSEWLKYQEKNKSRQVKPWDMLNPRTEFVEEEISEYRYNICKSCPELIKLTKTCKKCGCFMSAKTKLKYAACPINKW
jgi:hypothetical protein